MALIRPHLPEICWTGDWRTLDPSDACLTISAPDMPLLKVSFVIDIPSQSKNAVELSKLQGSQEQMPEAMSSKRRSTVTCHFPQHMKQSCLTMGKLSRLGSSSGSQLEINTSAIPEKF